MGYYISFLKAIALKFNAQTVQLFLNMDNDNPTMPQSFPLYMEALKFFRHRVSGAPTLHLASYVVLPQAPVACWALRPDHLIGRLLGAGCGWGRCLMCAPCCPSWRARWTVQESMVRAGVRTLTLSVYSIRDDLVRNFLLAQPAVDYFRHLSMYLSEQCQVRCSPGGRCSCSPRGDRGLAEC